MLGVSLPTTNTKSFRLQVLLALAHLANWTGCSFESLKARSVVLKHFMPGVSGVSRRDSNLQEIGVVLEFILSNRDILLLIGVEGSEVDVVEDSISTGNRLLKVLVVPL